jgi:Tfp pilus assembly protein PilN
MSVKGKEVYIITAVVAIVLIAAWYFLLLSPARTELSDLNDQIQSQQSALATAQQEVARLEAYKKTAPQSRAEIVRLGKMLPESEGIPSLIIELTRTADASGVNLDSITRGVTAPGTPFGLQSVALQVTGRFFDVEDFLYRLESYVAFRNASFRVTGRLLEVKTLSISGGGDATTSDSAPPLTVTIELNAYLWAGASSAAAGTPAAGGTP